MLLNHTPARKLKTILRPWRPRIFRAIYKIFNHSSIIVYTIPKAGSTSILISLKRSLGHTRLIAVAQAHDFQGIMDPKKVFVYSDTYYLISLVRNPIERALSAVFFFMIPERNKRGSTPSTDISVWKRRTKHRITRSLEWFNQEMKNGFGIDVYAAPFSTEIGYRIYTQTNHHLLKKVNLLVLRTELDDDKKSRIIREFLGLNRLEIMRYRESRLDPDAMVYQEMKQRIKFSPEYTDQICNHKHTQHFFSAREVSAMRARWSE